MAEPCAPSRAMPAALPNHLSYCELGGRLILLDLRRDRYLEVAGRVASALRRWSAGQADETDMATLAAAGLTTADGRNRAPSPTAVSVPAKGLSAPPVRPRMTDVLQVAVATLAVRAALRRGRLEQAIDRLRKGKARATISESDGPALSALVGRFEAARRLVPAPRQCLPDALVLGAFLIRGGVAPTVVIGVKHTPFAAHCWVQTSDQILSCPAEDAAAFAPILAL